MRSSDIVELRIRLGLTQAELASMLGCHPMAVSQWERGVRTPTGLYAAAINRLMIQPPAAKPSGHSTAPTD